jgi:hypothetical protein
LRHHHAAQQLVQLLIGTDCQLNVARQNAAQGALHGFVAG